LYPEARAQDRERGEERMGKVFHLDIVPLNSYSTFYRHKICAKMAILQHKPHL
jgi:hypothetical protein